MLGPYLAVLSHGCNSPRPTSHVLTAEELHATLCSQSKETHIYLVLYGGLNVRPYPVTAVSVYIPRASLYPNVNDSCVFLLQLTFWCGSYCFCSVSLLDINTMY